jgi:predicted enzyme related to lactoylglutathione lyase
MRPAHDKTSKLITFLYYVDLPRAMAFYSDLLGLKLAIDQGWSKIYEVTQGGYVGLVDEAHGSHRSHPVKPVQICLRVADVDAWCAYLQSKSIEIVKGPKNVDALGIRVIVFNDPEGYQVEIQSLLPDAPSGA